LIINIVLDLRN